MSCLGDFLERISASDARFATVRATIRCWHDRLYAAVAAETLGARSSRKAGHVGGTPAERVSEAEIRVWLASENRGRAEVRPLVGNHWFPQLMIVDADCSWIRNGNRQPTVLGANRTPGCLARADRHFSRQFIRVLFASLDLEEAGSGRVAGHDCILVRARPTPDSLLWPHWFPYGAEEYDLYIDPERAVILAITARVGEAVFETNEVVEVTYDEPLGEELFTPPEPGSPPRVIRRRRS